MTDIYLVHSGDGKVFNYNTGEEITDENKKNEIINEFREQYK